MWKTLLGLRDLGLESLLQMKYLLWRQVTEKAWEYNISTVHLFIDFACVSKKGDQLFVAIE
jgi:hypothetical protein